MGLAVAPPRLDAWEEGKIEAKIEPGAGGQHDRAGLSDRRSLPSGRGHRHGPRGRSRRACR